MSASWVKFEGTQDQLDEMKNAPHGWIVRRNDGAESDIFRESPIHSGIVNSEISEYLICKPLPHAEMIARHAMTGQPVYFFKEVNECWKTTSYPAWLEHIKYSFSPPREKKFIEVRDYLILTGSKYSKHCVHRSGNLEDDLHMIVQHETRDCFIRWIDQDWRRIEI